MTQAAAAAAAAESQLGHPPPPPCILLETRARIGLCQNETTAEATTSEGHTIVVSFSATDPPALSRCFVHCPNLTAEDFFFGEPRVTGGGLLLIRVSVTTAPGRRHGLRWRFTDMFVYRAAGPAGKPSLCLLPRPYPHAIDRNHVGVLSCGDRYSVVVVVVAVQETRFDDDEARRGDYHLSVFSSESASWSSIVAPMAAADLDGATDYDLAIHHDATKVVSDGGGVWLAWVDLRRGVLLCNVADDKAPAEMRLVRLPPRCQIGDDVTFRNGVLWFIGIEYHHQQGDMVADLSYIYKPEFGRWTATMFRREICSAESAWDRCWTVDSADLRPADTCLPDLFPEIWDGKELTLNRVTSTCPVMDKYDDNVFYIKAVLNAGETNGWVLAINARGLTLERVVPFSNDVFYFKYQQCAFDLRAPQQGHRRF